MSRAVRRKRIRRNRRVAKILFLLCCMSCFLCGFQFRGNQTIAMAADGNSDGNFSQNTFDDTYVGDSISRKDFQEDLSTKTQRQKYFTSITVETGDTLYDIANKYMTSEFDSIDQYITELKQVNGMIGNHLQQGDYLTIPYYK